MANLIFIKMSNFVGPEGSCRAPRRVKVPHCVSCAAENKTHPASIVFRDIYTYGVVSTTTGQEKYRIV